MIQTSIRNSRNEVVQLTPNDPEYWEGPYRYEPYPKALYRQTQPGEACDTRVVNSDDERAKLGSDWFESPADAKVQFEKLEADMARADAERRASDQRMSALAIGEALRGERATDQMLGEIKEKPKRKYVKKSIPSVS